MGKRTSAACLRLRAVNNFRTRNDFVGSRRPRYFMDITESGQIRGYRRPGKLFGGEIRDK